MAFGERLRQLRAAHGLGLRELAAKAGIDYSLLSKIENGLRQSPKAGDVLALARALELSDSARDEFLLLAERERSDFGRINQHTESRSDASSAQVRKNWWRTKRLPEIEMLAAREIDLFEACIHQIDGPCIPVDEILRRQCGYELVKDQPERYGAPKGALAVLLPRQLLVVLSNQVTHLGRRNMTIGHEIAHILLHLSSEDRPQDNTERVVPMLYCRGNTCGTGTRETPWMTREAEWFSAHLLMPRDRYLPLAERHLTQTLKQVVEPLGYSIEEVESSARLRVEVGEAVIDMALDDLLRDLRGEVSRQAQQIRLQELGLVRRIPDPRQILLPLDMDVDGRPTPECYELTGEFVQRAADSHGWRYSADWRGEEGDAGQG